MAMVLQYVPTVQLQWSVCARPQLSLRTGGSKLGAEGRCRSLSEAIDCSSGVPWGGAGGGAVAVMCMNHMCVHVCHTHLVVGRQRALIQKLHPLLTRLPTQPRVLFTVQQHHLWHLYMFFMCPCVYCILTLLLFYLLLSFNGIGNGDTA